MKFTPARCQSHHVLVVDDEEIVLVALRETLRQLGFQVTAVADAIEALARLQTQTYSLVMTDHQMPRLTGMEFLAEARRIQPRATRVLITAVLNVSTVIDAINRAEVCRFLLKPWQRDELLAAVEAGIERYESIDELHQRAERLAQENAALKNRVQSLEDEQRTVFRSPG
jgi:DNA-binding NtrC family response regulator